MARRRNTSVFVVLIVAIFAFWWGISLFSSHPAQTLAVSSPSQTTTTDGYVVGAPVKVVHALKNGSDTWSGSVALPSSCDYLGTGIATSGTNPAHVTLLLSIYRTPVCAAAQGTVNTEPFSVSLLRAAQPPVLDGVTVNGVIVPIQVEEAGS